ncbi:MAG: tetratricopeptide repeat protein [Prevotellaceae bacterium]|jgi:tetratricopeptide (TPR) repeat protein|nr:tetratricopeptide repeat protein [Prevotellaceae bacterium]
MSKRLLIILLFTLQSSCGLFAQLNTDHLLSVGRNALYFEDYVLSIQYFNQVIKAKPYLTEAYYFRAVAKIYLEDYSGAEDDLNAVIERNPFMPMAYYARGFAEKHLNKLENAEEDLNKALEFSPDNITFLLNRLEIYDRQEKYDHELADIDYLLNRTHSIPELSVEKGRVLLLKGDTLGALRVADATVRSDSLLPEAWGMRGLLRLMLQQHDSALADYNRAIALDAQNASYYTNRGIIRYENKNFRGALADYDRAVSLRSDDYQVLLNRALLRNEVGDYNNALADLDRVISLQPDLHEAVYQRAIIAQQLGFHEEAVRDFSQIIENYSQFVPAFYGRAQSYEALNRHQLAYNDMSTAFTLNEMRQKNKDKPQDKTPEATVQIAKEEASFRERAKLFATGETQSEDTRYKNNILRGTIQNRRVEVENRGNFVLSYYQNDNLLHATIHYDSLLNLFNLTIRQRSALKLVSEEIPLTNALIDYHFKAIHDLTDRLQTAENNGNLYFERGIDYALVQDLNSAIADFSSAITYGAGALAYFCRANMRYKQLEITLANAAARTTPKEPSKTTDYTLHIPAIDRSSVHEGKLILRDYDETLALNPSFCYAWYNRANTLSLLGEYRLAIADYTHAIGLNGDFAEAYFNRGLVYIFLGEAASGIADLSKAGELGIYQAYSLLKKIR